MKTEYLLQAIADSPAAEAQLPAFVDLLLRLAPDGQVQPIPGGINVHLPFQPDLLPSMQRWAAFVPGVSVREWFIRKFPKAECASAAICQLSFSNCYLVPEPTRFAYCETCGGNIEVPTGRQPTRIDFKFGIGSYDGAVYLSKANAEIIRSSGLCGFSLKPWSNNSRFWRLLPDYTVEQILIEGQNALGLTGTSCERCGRPELRYDIGPPAVRKSDYRGGDFIGLDYMGFKDIAFSQAAAAFLTSTFRGARYVQPVWLL